MAQLPEYSVTKTYSMTLAHIAKVKDLAQRWKVSDAEVLRNAIDEYYKAHADDNPSPSHTPEQVQA